ncbi:TonB periplasmic protein (plasmid) [Komagataeibacter medellinensis NBRC 3288]|uniref:TonB periplasmic protein n=2 Tax=Komagataeibacter medellinensis TaxID=1177712 RepID=G2I8C6_KOMMN|nr:TonB periplasmic protein [Komagataeibacter medellinensis NBRC 3288]
MDGSVQQQDRTAGRILVTSTGPAGWRRGRLLAGWAIMAAVLGHGLIAAWLLPARAPVPAAPAEKNSIQVFFDQPGVAPPPQEATPQPQPQPQPKAVATLPAVTARSAVRPVAQSRSPSAQPSAQARVAAPVGSAPAATQNGPAVPGAAQTAAVVPTAPHCTPPAWRYPAMARHMHEEGNALVDVVLGSEGQVVQVSLKSGTGYDDLDSTALAAARKVQCTPQGRPLEGTHVLLPVTFRLH